MIRGIHCIVRIMIASRNRRWMLAGVFLVIGLFFVAIIGDVPPQKAWRFKLIAPMATLFGLGGLIYPASIPDPRPEAGRSRPWH
jgi:hypothetical protein